MIVRIAGEDQYELPDDHADRLNDLDNEAVAAGVRVTRVIEPRPDWIEPYAEARERFRGLYPALRPLQV